MNANVAEFLTALVRHSAAAGVLVLLVLATQRVFRHQLAPRWHCALWLLVVVRLLPFSISSDASVFNLFARWGVRPLTSAAAVLEPPTPEQTRLLLTTLPTPGLSSAANHPSSAPAAGLTLDPSEPARGFFTVSIWLNVLFFGWLAGVLLLGGYILVVSISLTRSLALLKPLDDPAVLNVLHDCCARMGIRRAPVLIDSGAVHTPALHGLLRPRLLLPVGFTAEYSSDEQRFVFLHELAHLRRRDLAINWLMAGLQIVHWFNPLVWFGFARWRVDREIACDAAALEIAGPESNRAYGRTILRLLQNLSASPARPGLIGILEDKRQLRRRLQKIAAFTPARQPFLATGVIGLLAIIGLTDAQVEPTRTSVLPDPGPAAPASATPPEAQRQPANHHVLYLLNGSETMLGEWPRTLQSLERMLTSLEADTHFQVRVFNDEIIPLSLARREEWFSPKEPGAMSDVISKLHALAPHGSANLERAIKSMRSLNRLPDRIVLLTDGLPTRSDSVPAEGDLNESDRMKFFQAATKQLPPRIPVHTVLMPAPSGDPSATGLYWELANVTRGGLTCPALPGVEPRTHLAFIIDTSGSMRAPDQGGLWPIVIDTIEATLDAQPQLAGIQILDGDGRFILGRRGGVGKAGWLPDTPDVRAQIVRVLRRYDQDTVSNPVPGIYNAIRFLHDKDAVDMHMGIYVLGDEFNSKDTAQVVLDRIDELNPRDANGRRSITISAFGFPTTIRYQFSMGNTGLRFAHLMRALTYEHDGTFVALPDL